MKKDWNSFWRNVTNEAFGGKMRKVIILFVAVSIVFISCGRNPMTTVLGATGAKGDKGEQGLPGADGNGNISVNTTWTASGGPYVVSKNIVVKAGVILAIEPGATVSINPNCIVYVDGTLSASGTIGKHITFKTESPQGYGSIFMGSTSINNVIKYWDVQGNTLFLRTGVSGITIENCKFSYPAGFTSSAIYINSSASCVVNNCTIDGPQTGIYSDGTLSANNCIIINGSYAGVYVNSLNTIVTGCYINNNSNGFYSSGTSLSTITGSNIYGNTVDYSNYSTANQTATGNWWGTNNTATIDSKIYDKNDDGAKGTVNYSGYLSIAVTGITGCGW